jgi:hypothetical protein
MRAGSEQSIRNVAERGFNLLLGQYASPDDVAQSVAWYEAGFEASWRRYDPMQVGVTRAFFVADNAMRSATRRWAAAYRTDYGS